MSSEPKTDAVGYRWVVIFLIWLANTCGALTQLSGGPVQLSVAKEFGLNAAQLATWINLPLLAIGLFSIPAGILVDRFGARAGVAFALLLMSVFALGRGLAPSFAWLCFATFAFGIGYAFLLSGMPKAVSEWFPPHELGRAVGFYTSGASVGVLTVFWFAIPVFGEKWRDLFLAAGFMMTVAFLAWLVLGKRSSRAASGHGDPGGHGAPGGVADMLRSFRSVASQRDVRLLVGLCAMTQIGVFGWLAFGFPYLVIAKGAPEETAGQVVAFTMVGFLFGALSVSGLSDRVGKRRPFLIGPALVTCLLFFGLIVVPLGWLFWAMVLLIGFCLAALQVLLFALPLELPGVSKDQVGACEGLIISIGYFFGIAASPVLGSLLGSYDTTTPQQFFVVVGCMGAALGVGTVLSFLMSETGPAGRKASA